MNYKNSKDIFEKAVNIIPGGVNSPVRAFKSVEKEFPIFVKSANKAHLMDEDGNKYIDFIQSWGPMILGHNDERVIKAVQAAVLDGCSFGLPTKKEVELAELIISMVPSIEKVRLTTSGTEATMAAVRVARAYTKKNKILKFEGCYHGHSDSLLVAAGSGLLTEGYQDSNGLTEGVLKDTLTLPFGNLEKVEKLMEKEEIACIIVEPIPANMGLIETKKEYLEGLRKLCTEHNTLLIFDEVISGFRIAAGGAQEHYGITPDLTTLGKIIGGGYPVGAFGGKREIMDMIAPVGDVYHAGTLSGNPISVTAGFETLSILKNTPSLYTDLEAKVDYIVEGIYKLSEKYNVPVCVNKAGSLFTIFFTDKKKVETLEDVMASDTTKYSKYFNAMLENGVVVPPSKFEAHFMGATHNEEILNETLSAMEKAFIEISK
ncbi:MULTISPECIES: glutamate-1-semialdehyde 2,1-aminomutase [Psychrilyobacter]|uniref:Glutamate-1-semialdehyde 2,1-aminomutase n=1 Tax=Psychrilyobacter piezotolerans TaxID=2293438 RepID=A0ABX9KI43_9FUSO|nr:MULTISPECIES: glutamate-1-semialdehyde 2,1-aminomutase [Psychrilyobacter]MCS5421666.1 glutamate-1-semialdehyde 2,1-aminomutase [Psychrilyobacter sp. S5]NDI77234.1 glutamate-1-semialdehyde 2,1-aminomutase [Psychrilyobacter piezotolerans]RDE63292.1 glutamate-1-semialdehyde-2,1-aminomutase [Psychrilyobacter sp. S5]REI41834.1 glutamate-1-semialdehyde-2,1-aminomutase [Psychrilyobacter piezotolerans]